MNLQKIIIKSFIGFAVLLFVIFGWSRVDTGQVGIKTFNGKVIGNPISAGLVLQCPLFCTLNILNTRVQTVEADSSAASKDLQNVQTQLTLNYHLGTQDPTSHFIRLGADQVRIENTIVKPAMSETYKAIVAQYNAEELVKKRDTVSSGIVDLLNKKLKQYDLFVDSISVTNFKFSNAYAKAIEDKQVAEQHVGQVTNELQSVKVDAQKKIVEAQADAEAMRLRKQAVTPELIQLKELDIQLAWINKWSGALPTTSLGGNFMPVMNNGGISMMTSINPSTK